MEKTASDGLQQQLRNMVVTHAGATPDPNSVWVGLLAKYVESDIEHQRTQTRLMEANAMVQLLAPHVMRILENEHIMKKDGLLDKLFSLAKQTPEITKMIPGLDNILEQAKNVVIEAPPKKGKVEAEEKKMTAIFTTHSNLKLFSDVDGVTMHIYVKVDALLQRSMPYRVCFPIVPKCTNAKIVLMRPDDFLEEIVPQQRGFSVYTEIKRKNTTLKVEAQIDPEDTSAVLPKVNPVYLPPDVTELEFTLASC